MGMKANLTLQKESNMPDPTKPYNLTGPQGEPAASYWNLCPGLHMVTCEELKAVTEVQNGKHYFPPYSSEEAENDLEIKELKFLGDNRDNSNQVKGNLDLGDKKPRERKPISEFLKDDFLKPAPLGAVLVDQENHPGIQTGRQLARYFENETPGLAHRHALNKLITLSNWSPPRQALVWAALDVTIASAMQAAWYYKWLSPRTLTSRRQRPLEYDNTLEVLYDTPEPQQTAPLCPTVMRGTPRHPAYPSGHSTYAGAASELLSFFFDHKRSEFDNLADNAGVARMWAGIHWRSDHEVGLKLGRTVAHLIIQQLADSGVVLCPPPPPPGCDDNKAVPTLDDLESEASKFSDSCDSGSHKQIPKPCRGGADQDPLNRSKSVQQGAF